MAERRPADQGPADLLIGRWTGGHPDDPTREVTYDFEQSGRFVLAGVYPGLAKVTIRGTWKVLSSKDKSLRISTSVDEREVADNRGNRVPSVAKEEPKDVEQTIEFLSAERFRLTTSKGRVVEATRVHR
jgi:hypothetical protein